MIGLPITIRKGQPKITNLRTQLAILDSYRSRNTNIDKEPTYSNPHLSPIPRLHQPSSHAYLPTSPIPTCRHPIEMPPPPHQPPQSHSHSQDPSTSTQTQTYTQTPVLRLRATGPSPSSTVQNRARIQWASDVIDNEGMGRKSSKGIYSSFFVSTNLLSAALPKPSIQEN